jgi:hypothetical protein
MGHKILYLFLNFTVDGAYDIVFNDQLTASCGGVGAAKKRARYVFGVAYANFYTPAVFVGD